MSDVPIKSEILRVVQKDDDLYFLRIDYEVEDIASAIGRVFQTDAAHQQGTVPQQVLATNDTLRSLWVSPQESLWVASADGSVGTTAAVQWPAPTSGADYMTLGSSPKWVVTDLPRVKATGLPPNVTALWGTSDEDVYAGTYGGHVYRWDGRAWTQVFDGPGQGNRTIRAFGGKPDGVYAVGAMQTLLHFNGQSWRQLRVPGPLDDSETFTGICDFEGQDVLISGSGEVGRLLQGSASGGLTEFGRYPVSLLDMAQIEERILFAAGDGVAELIGRDVQVIKTTVKAISMSAGHGRAFFIQPEQSRPAFIEYSLHATTRQWLNIQY